MAKLEIKTDEMGPMSPLIKVDGEEIRRCTKADLHMEVDHIPTLIIEQFVMDSVDIQIEGEVDITTRTKVVNTRIETFREACESFVKAFQDFTIID